MLYISSTWCSNLSTSWLFIFKLRLDMVFSVFVLALSSASRGGCWKEIIIHYMIWLYDSKYSNRKALLSFSCLISFNNYLGRNIRASGYGWYWICLVWFDVSCHWLTCTRWWWDNWVHHVTFISTFCRELEILMKRKLQACISFRVWEIIWREKRQKCFGELF